MIDVSVEVKLKMPKAYVDKYGVGTTLGEKIESCLKSQLAAFDKKAEIKMICWAEDFDED